MTENEYRHLERWLNAALEVFRLSPETAGPHDAEIRSDIRNVLEKVVAQKLRIESKTERTTQHAQFTPGLN